MQYLMVYSVFTLMFWSIFQIYNLLFHYLIFKYHHDAGSDAILLGAETLRGLYPVETISTVGKICAEVSLLL